MAYTIRITDADRTVEIAFEETKAITRRDLDEVLDRVLARMDALLVRSGRVAGSTADLSDAEIDAMEGATTPAEHDYAYTDDPKPDAATETPRTNTDA